MVARINTGKSINKALNYNEKKVQHGKAECLHAQNFLKEVNAMNFYEKQKTFEKFTSLNERAQTNSVHISLNFDPTEKLSKETLVEIANNYMERIGFKNQPYLVYQHHDTGHPHIHIVSTNIKHNGNRISMHNMGRNESEVARKEIEKAFDLVKAESKKQETVETLKPVNAQKINPGIRSTKSAITNVLRAVIRLYKYSSLEELNAILQLYNVRADRCGLDSETYKHDGLLYRVLDQNGRPTGTPIKASRFEIKPTLKNLKILFEKNSELKHANGPRIKTTIDYILKRNPGINLQKLDTELKKEGISLVIRKNKDGIIYGMTYVDHKTKTVFNGSDLGKQYSAKAMLEKCDKQIKKETHIIADEKKKVRHTEIPLSEIPVRSVKKSFELLSIQTDFKIIGTLLKPEEINAGVPYPLKQSSRRRRKKKLRI